MTGDLSTFKGPFPKEQQLARKERRYRRKVASPKTWARILDARQGPCLVCGAPPPNQMAHLVARAQGGSDCESNIAPLCGGPGSLLCHERFDAGNQIVCQKVALALDDSQYAYCVDKLGESGFLARFKVRFNERGTA